MIAKLPVISSNKNYAINCDTIILNFSKESTIVKVEIDQYIYSVSKRELIAILRTLTDISD